MIRKKFQSSFIFPIYFSADYSMHVLNQYYYNVQRFGVYSLNFMKIASKVNNHNLEESYEDFLPEKTHKNFVSF